MRLGFQIALVILIGLGAIYAGISNFYSPLSVISEFYAVDISSFSSEARLAVETQIRLLSGMWIAAGVVTILSVRKFEENTNVLRLIFLGLSLGAVGELVTAKVLGGNIEPALIKALFQVSICVGMEFWRWYTVERMPTGSVT